MAQLRAFVRRDSFLPFSRPSIGAAEIAEVVDSLQSGWITTGPKAQRFERAFGEYVGAPHALAVSSATGGLHIGLIALGLKPGDEVVTTSMTWASTVNMIEALGATPVFVDIDRTTMQLDASAIESVITSRTVGVLPVHFAGAPCDVDTLLATAHKHQLWVFEDAAHGVGTHYKGRHVGSFDRLGVFSFHAIKNLTTGEGGCLTTRDDKLAQRLQALRFHGLAKSAWNRYAEGGTPQVEVIEPGFKYNFMDLQAAIGIHQLAAVDEFNAKRRALAALYDRLLAELSEIACPQVPRYEHTHAWHLYVIALRGPSGLSRDALMTALRERNVGTGLHFRAVHTQPYYKDKYPRWIGALPETEWISERLLSLPLFPTMSEEDVHYVVDAIKDALGAARDRIAAAR